MDQPRAEETLKKLEPLVGEWALQASSPDGEPFPQRFTASFEDNGNTIIGRWEKAENGKRYETDFNLTYRKLT
jgi:hypothetical protein